MRKLAVLIVSLLLVQLYAASHDNSEYGLYREYLNEPGSENFTKAHEYYGNWGDNEGKILQSYLHWQELNRLLSELSSEQDSLSMSGKFQFANLLLEIGRYEESIEVYEVLNEASPKWACPWRHKGEALWKMDNLEEAETALKKSIEVRENHYDAYVMLAEVQKDGGKYDEALETLEKGLQYRAENPEYSEDEEFEKNVQELLQELRQKQAKNR